MSNPTTAETLLSVRASIREAYKARKSSHNLNDTDTMHAFGLVTSDTLSALRPYPGLGKTARVSRLRRADNNLLAAYVMTVDTDVRDILVAAQDVVGSLLDSAEAEVETVDDSDTYDEDGNQITGDWVAEDE